MGGIQFSHAYHDIISLENLVEAWRDFEKGKRKKKDVEEFGRHLGDELVLLHRSLADGTYRHGGYEHFIVTDPKRRDIHKASVRDRVVHRAVYRKLCPFFERVFIADSYSCRKRRGVHRALRRFEAFARRVSRNNTRQCWVLKCDIRKFFASVDQEILFEILRAYITDEKVLLLLWRVVGSFDSGQRYVGLPLGNLTSQLLVNVYMNEFDSWVKHKLKARFYIRYADDFVFLSNDVRELEKWRSMVASFLEETLRLQLHPHKVFIKTLSSGVDFLGWVHFPNHRVPRAVTKRKIQKIVRLNTPLETIQSYKGLLSHGNAKKLQAMLG